MNPQDPIAEQTAVQTNHIREVGSVTLKPHKGKSDLASLLDARKYDWVNPDITPEHFTEEVIGPLDEETELIFVTHYRNTTSEEMLAYGAANNLVPANPGDILRLGIQHPELQRAAPYVALHELLVLGSHGDRYFLALWSGDGKSFLGLRWFGHEWRWDFVFVFRRKP